MMFRGRLCWAIVGQPVFALSSFDAAAFVTVGLPSLAQPAKAGGARRDRTDDLMLAKHALSQLSYGPVPEDECLLACRAVARVNQPAFAHLGYGAAAFVQEGLPSRSCRAAKAGGPGKT